MTAHIGIVGCSAAGAALCYRTICEEGASLLGPHAHPEVSMHTPSLALYVDRLECGDRQGVADLMLASAHKLAAVGANFLICPDNTIHLAYDLVQATSPLPWLHIAEEVAATAVQHSYRRVGITGTDWLMGSEVYPAVLRNKGLDFALPNAKDRVRLNSIIMDELVCGIIKPDSVREFLAIIDRLKDDGCDAVILGCTELPLIASDDNSSLPTLDSTRLLAGAALRRAFAG
ncbi:aspartate/glutamate racemase family protein [Undibacterium umbellatum]|uniref:Amino acid racemase n=1 Tax=Undibacterium umbellatum TaxID=2762300 RepID=A0ABR6ZFQ6_9BURK|nr:amino acid racemase [Undibacterium umbellatum]MBC3910557.1 amino acid racemase [Undibacterium umbellatum]